MAIRPILELPHPTLRQRAKKIRKIDSSVLRLAYDMVDTMIDAGGVGLAANQVGVPRRVIVVKLPEEEEARIYINPEISHREGEREVEEGCLSIPGYKALILRSVWVKFQALDHSSQLIRLRAEDLLSQALEHEVDHLNGILYVDHLKAHQQLIPVEDEALEPGNGAANGHHSHSPIAASSEPSRAAIGDSQDTPASLKLR